MGPTRVVGPPVLRGRESNHAPGEPDWSPPRRGAGGDVNPLTVPAAGPFSPQGRAAWGSPP